MVTVKTLNNSRNTIKNIIHSLSKIGSGSISLNNKIDLQILDISPTKVFYKVENNIIELTFDNDPEINILYMRRNVFKVEISEASIIFHIKYFPDIKIEIES